MSPGPPATERLLLLIAALLGLTGLILAAAGSHIAPGLDDFRQYKSWQSANTMHLVHSLAVLFLSIMYRHRPARIVALAALFMIAGVVLFSGSIYLSLTDLLVGATRVAPAGGMLMMLGWLLLAIHAIWWRAR